MKKIICAIDYSSNSIAALKYAVSLGHLLKEDIIVLHVYNPEIEHVLHGKKGARKTHQEKLSDFCKSHLQDQFNPSEISFAAIGGENIPEAISDFVRDLNIHMIVMGACGTSTIKEMILGSTTKEMSEISPFPVLAVPSDFIPGTVKKVIFASVLDDKDVDHLLDLVHILSPATPEINVVHITHKEEISATKKIEDFKARVEKRTNYSNLTYHSIFSANVYETLENTIDELNADLVVLPDFKGKNEVNKVIIRDKIKHMQSCTKIPVLSFSSIK